MTQRRLRPGDAPRVRSLFPSALAILLITACSGPEAAPIADTPWSDAPDSLHFRQIVMEPDGCEGCIDLRMVAVLGDETGEGYVVSHTEAVVRDSLGRYWVGQQAGAMRVFDTNGAFMREVGRAGQGPLEFTSPQPIYTDAEGRVHVLDPGNLRESVIGDDFQLVRDATLPARFGAVTRIGGTEGYVINGWIGTAAALGMPLHVMREGELATSFGLTSASVGSVLDPFTVRRILAVDQEGRILETELYEYTIQAWDADGRRLHGWKGPALNATRPLPGRWTNESPPPNRIEGMQLDANGNLWIISVRVKDNWRDFIQEELLPTGEIALATKPGFGSTDLYGSRIEVLDLDSGRIIAREDRPNIFVAFIGQSLMLEAVVGEDGTPHLGVWEVALRSER